MHRVYHAQAGWRYTLCPGKRPPKWAREREREGRGEQEKEKSTSNQQRYTRVISGVTKCELIGKRGARAPRLEGRTACKY